MAHQGPPGGPPAGGWRPPVDPPSRGGGDQKSCSEVESMTGLATAASFFQCSNLNWEALLSAVIAEAGEVTEVEKCFENVYEVAKKKEEDKTDEEKKDETALDAEVQELRADLKACLDGVRASGGDAADVDLADELTKDEAKACQCLPDFIAALPECGEWPRYRDGAYHAALMCQKVPGMVMPTIPVTWAQSGAATGTAAANDQAGGNWDRFDPSNGQYLPQQQQQAGPEDMASPYGPAYDPRSVNTRDPAASSAASNNNNGYPAAYDAYGPPGRNGQAQGGPAVGPLGMGVLLLVAVAAVVAGVVAVKRRMAGSGSGGGGGANAHFAEYGYARAEDDDDAGTELGAYRAPQLGR